MTHPQNSSTAEQGALEVATALTVDAENLMKDHPNAAINMKDAAEVIRALLAAHPVEPEPVARPDIIEKLTYHRLERDDMTLDDCLEYLANRWKKIPGRPERALIMQITELLASQPAAPVAHSDAQVAQAIRINGEMWTICSPNEFYRQLWYMGIGAPVECVVKLADGTGIQFFDSKPNEKLNAQQVSEIFAALEWMPEALTAQPTAAIDVRDAALNAHNDLLTYVLQDDIHNRLTPRVIDIAYTAFMKAKAPNDEDGGASDWFTDTKPIVMKAIEKLRKDLQAEALKSAPSAQAAAVTTEYGWLVENGKNAPDLRYRTMTNEGITWTDDHNKALRFARREDAEMFAAEDEDAWRIVQHAWDTKTTVQPSTAEKGGA